MKNEPHRPNVIIDWNEVDRLLEIGCTGTEIASSLGISPDTLYRRTVEEKTVFSFSVYQQQKRAKGFFSLREAQHTAALNGSVPMLIWLGKQFLNQKEPEPVVSEQNKSALVEYIEMQKKKEERPNEKSIEQDVVDFSVLEMQKESLPKG